MAPRRPERTERQPRSRPKTLDEEMRELRRLRDPLKSLYSKYIVYLKGQGEQGQQELNRLFDYRFLVTLEIRPDKGTWRYTDKEQRDHELEYKAFRFFIINCSSLLPVPYCGKYSGLNIPTETAIVSSAKSLLRSLHKDFKQLFEDRPELGFSNLSLHSPSYHTGHMDIDKASPAASQPNKLKYSNH